MSEWEIPREWSWASGMPLGDTLNQSIIACACVGPGPGCFCAQSAQHALMLRRGAHIVARLLADVAGRAAPPQARQDAAGGEGGE